MGVCYEHLGGDLRKILKIDVHETARVSFKVRLDGATSQLFM